MTRGGTSAQHRASRDLGETFELWIDVQHEQAGYRGALAHVVHNQATSKVVGGKIIFSGAGVADFTGCFHGGGVLAAEAKSTAKDRLPKNEITLEQQKHLSAVATAGGNSLAILLVEFRGALLPGHPALHRHYAVPWFKVPWKVLKSAESVGEVDLLPWAVPPGVDYLSRYHNGSHQRYVVGAATKNKRVHPRE